MMRWLRWAALALLPFVASAQSPGGGSLVNPNLTFIVASPTNGQVLTYVSAAAAWENATGGGGSSAFSALTSGTNTTCACVLGSGSTLEAYPSTFLLKGSSTGYTTFASANASATNYTLTFPAATDTVVTLAATQTLTNKSIDAGQITSASAQYKVLMQGASAPSFQSVRQVLGVACASEAQSTTDFCGPGGILAGQTEGFLVPFAGSLRNLYFRTANAPASGQTFTVTAFVGTPGTSTATALTCQIASSSSNQLCSDVSDNPSVAAGNEVIFQVVTSATSGATSGMMIGVEFDAP